MTGGQLRALTDEIDRSQYATRSIRSLYAAGCGHPGRLERLLNRRAAIDAKDHRRLTALDHASVNGHKEMVQALVDVSLKR